MCWKRSRVLARAIRVESENEGTQSRWREAPGAENRYLQAESSFVADNERTEVVIVAVGGPKPVAAAEGAGRIRKRSRRRRRYERRTKKRES